MDIRYDSDIPAFRQHTTILYIDSFILKVLKLLKDVLKIIICQVSRLKCPV
jgi:hypothetical protein